MPEAPAVSPEKLESEIEYEAVQSISNKFHELMGKGPPTAAPVPPPEAPAKPPAAPPKSSEQVSSPPKQQVESKAQPESVSPPDSTPRTDADTPPASIRSEQGKKDWQTLKAKHAEEKAAWRKEREAFETQLKAKQQVTQGDQGEELKRISQERDQYRKQLEAAELLSSEEFGGYFEKQFNTEARMAESIVGHKFATEVKELLNEADSETRTNRLNEIMEELGKAKGPRLAGVIDRIERLRFERQEALKESDKAYARLREIRREKENREAVADAEKQRAVIEGALNNARKLPSFIPSDGDAEHNKGVNDRESFVKSFLTGQISEDALSLVPIWAAHGLWLSSVREPALQSEIKALKEQVQALTESQPRTVAAPDSGMSGKSEEGEEKDFLKTFWKLNPNKPR